MLLEDERYRINLVLVRHGKYTRASNLYQEKRYALRLSQLSILQLLGKGMPEKQNRNQGLSSA
jgi:hypothetical protein